MTGAIHGRGISPEEARRLEALQAEHRAQRPPIGRALRIDAEQYAANRGETIPVGRLRQWLTVFRLAWRSDDYLGVALYRVRSSLLAARVPVLPAIINRVCILLFNMNIDDHIVIGEGVYIPHGCVVLGGVTLIGPYAIICPWASIGTRTGSFEGPVLGRQVFVGTHSSILGPFSIGDRASLGAGSVVTSDVPADTAVAGVPARPVARAAAMESAS